MLPPRGSDGRTRVLFLTSTALGFATYEKELRRFTAVREDIDAVHIALRPNRVMKLAGLRVPLAGPCSQCPVAPIPIVPPRRLPPERPNG